MNYLLKILKILLKSRAKHYIRHPQWNKNKATHASYSTMNEEERLQQEAL